MRISDWSSDVCSSDLAGGAGGIELGRDARHPVSEQRRRAGIDRRKGPDRPGAARSDDQFRGRHLEHRRDDKRKFQPVCQTASGLTFERRRNQIGHEYGVPGKLVKGRWRMGQLTRRSRSEEHTSELQSLMRISYAVFCLKKKTTSNNIHKTL